MDSRLTTRWVGYIKSQFGLTRIEEDFPLRFGRGQVRKAFSSRYHGECVSADPACVGCNEEKKYAASEDSAVTRWTFRVVLAALVGTFLLFIASHPSTPEPTDRVELQKLSEVHNTCSPE